jgi:hypothetical protein
LLTPIKSEVGNPKSEKRKRDGFAREIARSRLIFRISDFGFSTYSMDA